MNIYDRGSSLFWLFFSVFVFIESLRLGIGTLRNPGMGFLAFGASGLLGILSLILLLQAICKKAEIRIQPIFAGILWKRVLFILVALLIYSQVLPLGGYLITTFFLMGSLFWIVEQQKIGWSLILSFLTTLITYLVFSKWLNCQFPDGLFGL
jgi:hypothetical protein